MDMMKYTYRYAQQMEFLCRTQPLSFLPRGRLMAELMGPWPHPLHRYETPASPVITETSSVAHSQRVPWRCITWGELKEFPMGHGRGLIKAPSSEMVPPLPCMAPATFPSPCPGGSLAPSHKCLGAFASLSSKVPNRRKISGLLLLFCVRPRAAPLEMLTSPPVTRVFRGFLGLLQVPWSCNGPTQILAPLSLASPSNSSRLAAELSTWSSCFSNSYSPKIYLFHLSFLGFFFFFPSSHFFSLAQPSKDILSCSLVLMVQLNFSVLPKRLNWIAFKHWRLMSDISVALKMLMNFVPNWLGNKQNWG